MKRAETVVLEKCVYTPSSLAKLLDKILPFLGCSSNVRGKKVLVKPNLISSRGRSLACTDPRFIIAVVLWFVENGASVRVGDSPAFGSAAGVLKHLGILEELRRLGAEVREFSSSKDVLLRGDIRVAVATEALECDLMINLPKVKAHNQMYVTLAVKNIFGIVKGIQKSILHMQYGGSHRLFAGIILDLMALLPAHVTIADGIQAMHVAGPLGGKPLDLYCVAASSNPLAVDTALLAVLELDPEKSPIWAEAKSRGYSGVFPSEIQYPLLGPDDFHGSGFMAPESLSPVRFNPFRFLSGHLRRMFLAIRT